MIKLFYAVGTCSLASHIDLEDAGAEYSTVRIRARRALTHSWTGNLGSWLRGDPPGALSGGAGTETNQAMAHRMNTYKKLVFSRSGRQKLTEWNNTEQVIVATDDELAKYLANGRSRRRNALFECHLAKPRGRAANRHSFGVSKWPWGGIFSRMMLSSRRCG